MKICKGCGASCTANQITYGGPAAKAAGGGICHACIKAAS